MSIVYTREHSPTWWEHLNARFHIWRAGDEMLAEEYPAEDMDVVLCETEDGVQQVLRNWEREEGWDYVEVEDLLVVHDNQTGKQVVYTPDGFKPWPMGFGAYSELQNELERRFGDA